MQYIGTIPMSAVHAHEARVDALVGKNAPCVGYSGSYRKVSPRKAMGLLAKYGPDTPPRLPRPGYLIALTVPGFNSVKLVNWGGDYEVHAH